MNEVFIIEFNTGFPANYLKQVINMINELIIANHFSVKVKKLRRKAKISSENRSMIHFYWRSLKFLEKKGFIYPIEGSKPSEYKLPITTIDYFEVIK